MLVASTFAMFGFGWWLLILTAFLLVLIALALESEGLGVGVLMGTLGTLLFFNASQTLSWLLTLNMLWALFVYLALGVIWAIIKWYIYAHKRLEAYKKLRDKWTELNAEKGVFPAGYDFKSNRYKEWLGRQPGGWVGGMSTIEFRIVPRPLRNTERIISWMMFWPWSLIITATSDLSRFVYERLCSWSYNIMDRIAKWVFSDIEEVQ